MTNNTITSKLANDKIKINWNKKPIKMDLFLSFLTVEVEKSYDHLGACTGWTLYKNDSINLIVKGGIVREHGCEYLDAIEYGKKLQNKYNNYCNPFYLFEIMTDVGKEFFVNYYMEDIEKILKDTLSDVVRKERELLQAKEYFENCNNEFAELLKQAKQ